MLIVLVPLLLTLVYLYYIKKYYSYWARKRVKHDTPLPIFGNHLRTWLGLRTDPQMGVEMYQKYRREQIVGYYRGTTPELIIRDPDLLKCILNSDFNYAHARGANRDTKIEPLMMNIYTLDGEPWKLLRKRISAAFTTSKLRNMFNILAQCNDQLQDLTGTLAKRGEPVEVYELMMQFTAQFMCAALFGVHAKDEASDELANLKDFLKNSSITLSEQSSRDVFPLLQNYLVLNEKKKDIFVNYVKKVFERRNESSGTNDFLDFMIDLHKSGKIMGDILKTHSDGISEKTELEITMEYIAAQLHVFYTAGFDTSSVAMSFALHELAYHPEIQHKVQIEIDTILSKYNNEWCYNAIDEMPYLEMVIKESMRLFTPGAVYQRVFTRRYTLPGTDVTIDPGVRILIPAQALHMDNKYFPEPAEFRPERFSKEALKDLHSHAYLPFGEGPRRCVGERFARMTMLGALAALLQGHSVKPAPTSRQEISAKTNTFLSQKIDGSLPLIITAR